MADNFDDLLDLCREILDGNLDDKTAEKKADELFSAVFKTFPKEYITVLDFSVFKQALESVSAIKKSIEKSLKTWYGNDYSLEYNQFFWGMKEENLEFEVIIKDADVAIPSLDFWQIVKGLPDRFSVGVSPVENGFKIGFSFYKVKKTVT